MLDITVLSCVKRRYFQIGYVPVTGEVFASLGCGLSHVLAIHDVVH